MVATNNILWGYWRWYTSIRLWSLYKCSLLICIYAYMLAYMWQCKDACIQTSMCMVMFTEALVTRLSILPWILHWNVESLSPFLLSPMLSFTVTPMAMFHLFHHYAPTFSGLIWDSIWEQHICWLSLHLLLLGDFPVISTSCPVKLLPKVILQTRPSASSNAPATVSLSNPSASYSNYSHSLAIDHFERGSCDPLPNSFHYKFVFIFLYCTSLNNSLLNHRLLIPYSQPGFLF